MKEGLKSFVVEHSYDSSVKSNILATLPGPTVGVYRVNLR